MSNVHLPVTYLAPAQPILELPLEAHSNQFELALPTKAPWANEGQYFLITQVRQDGIKGSGF